ncbi:beta-ketoacyl-ACP reductase [Candidatus Woesearchaeota archaeon CG10_big_fil_rev_8_21_14_0_10_37_12]|nr:MAG: beta-ketoacyl-ACP reductase [Candidatus Woesearchaeota archaeon CG10_big_fil_rev_8_21_14_0_10_37_12]
MRFKDKVVLITGSSKGIGKATALLFAKEGAHIVINCSNSEEQGKQTVEEIKQLGRKAIFIKCDVSQEEQVKNMIGEAIKKFGKLDILVNNAGIVFDVPLFDKTEEQWNKTFAVNVRGVYLCSKYASKHMKKGAIVNVSSTNGIDTISPESADYDASKAAVNSLTKNLAKKLGPAIRVNAVAPGWIDTEINKDLPADLVEKEKKRIIFNRFGKPEEIGHAILFLASEEASFITGSILVVDGGYE